MSLLKRNKINTDINHYRYTFFGVAGSGKTSTAFYFFDDPIFFAWEQGQKTLEAYIYDCYTWKDMLAFIKEAKRELKENPDSELKGKVIVMDTAELMSNACQRYICDMNGWEDPADAGYGKGFTAIEEEMNKRLNELEELGFKVNFITHEKTKSTSFKDGVEYEKIIPSLGSKARSAVVDRVDVVMYFTYDYELNDNGERDRRRVVYFNGGDTIEAKSRIVGLPEKVIVKPSPEEAGEQLKEMFEDALKKQKKKGTAREDSAKKQEKKKEREKEELKTIKKRVTDLAMDLYKQKVVSAEDIQKIVTENTSVGKIEEINSFEELSKVERSLQDLGKDE